jgi:RNA-binding protein YhbY
MQLLPSILVTLAATTCLLSRDAAEGFAVVAPSSSPNLKSSCCGETTTTTRTTRRRGFPAHQQSSPLSTRRSFRVTLLHGTAEAEWGEEDGSDEDEGAESQDEGEEEEEDTTPSSGGRRRKPRQQQVPHSDPMERAWRHSKKPLLRIGAKGATMSHGNSLRQLLQDHTAVKVKVNTQSFHGDLLEAFERIRALAEESGAPAGIECIQARERDGVILFGMPGTSGKITSGEFPPPPPPPPPPVQPLEP